MGHQILIAEDDADIVELLRLYLENEKFTVFAAENGEEAYRIIQEQRIDLAVVDIMMPKMNGIELTRKIRETSKIPILILSAKNLDSDKILGLAIGADDYITKPFNPLEIIARVQSSLRRTYDFNEFIPQAEPDHIIKVGELIMDTASFTLQKNGQEILLTPMEFKVLMKLMQNPGMVLTKAQIYESINGAYFENDDNTMMVHISRLRDKIEDDPKQAVYIKTVRGIGYKIEKVKAKP